MAKNKPNKAQKAHAVFKVAGVRKTKTKAVNSSLKKLNVKNKSKTVEADKKYEAVQKILTEEIKQKKAIPKSKTKPANTTPQDMDVTTDAFSKL